MIDQAINSLRIGGIISVVMFIPVLIWQYRRYGAFQPGRTLWTVLSYIYLTALIAYTLFPMPDMSGDYCAAHPRVYVVDPTLYFREMAERLAGQSWQTVLLSWDVLQTVFNVALFVPLGVLFSDFLVMKARWGIPAGLGVSLLIEATQFTGNWGLMPCSYRVADVNDLITNTTGTAVGYLIALLIPRFIARPEYLRKRRLQARPVTIARRWTGMMLDASYFSASWMLAMTIASIAAFMLSEQPLVASDGSVGDSTRLAWNLANGMVLLLLVIVPGVVGSGASLGQRTVYLRPEGPRWRRIMRMLVVQGAVVIIGQVSLIAAAVMALWLVVNVFSVLVTRRGLSCVISGCQLVDARASSVPAASELQR